MRVEVSAMDDSIRVDVLGGRSTVMVINHSEGMPMNAATIPFRAVLIDCRRLNLEEGRLIERLPGRSRFQNVPILLFGGVAEVEEGRRAVVKATQMQWTGQVRSYDVLTDESSPHYTVTRRRLLAMVPDTRHIPKLPGVINITRVQTLVLGWTAVIGLFSVLWRQVAAEDAEEGEGTVEWLFSVSDDVDFPVLVAHRLDSAPSVIHCPLHAVQSLHDLGDMVGSHVQASENQPPLQWDDLTQRWTEHLPLFPKVTEAQVDSSSDDEPSTAAASAPPTPAAKPAPKPKPKAKRVVRKAKATAAPHTSPPPPSSSPAARDRAEPAARPSRRSRSRSRTPRERATQPSKEREQQLERDRQRQREKEQKRTEEREAERERDRQRAREREVQRTRERAIEAERERRRQRERDERENRERDHSRERHVVHRASDSHGGSSRASSPSACRSRMTGAEIRKTLGPSRRR